jgi:hypothetical protein
LSQRSPLGCAAPAPDYYCLFIVCARRVPVEPVSATPTRRSKSSTSTPPILHAQTDGGMKTALLEVIGGARVTLNCAFSALTLTDVTDAVINRARSGFR